MLFSATYDNAVMDFAEKLIKDAVSVTLKKEDLALSNIKQYFVECRDREAKYEVYRCHINYYPITGRVRLI